MTTKFYWTYAHITDSGEVKLEAIRTRIPQAASEAFIETVEGNDGTEDSTFLKNARIYFVGVLVTDNSPRWITVYFHPRPFVEAVEKYG